MIKVDEKEVAFNGAIPILAAEICMAANDFVKLVKEQALDKINEDAILGAFKDTLMDAIDLSDEETKAEVEKRKREEPMIGMMVEEITKTLFADMGVKK